MRGQQLYEVNDFRGYFARGPRTNIPQGYFESCQDLRFGYKSCWTRSGFKFTNQTLGGSTNNKWILGHYIYTFSDTTVRNIVVTYNAVLGGGTIFVWDLNHPTAAPFLVDTILQTTDPIIGISCVSLYDRFYFSYIRATTTGTGNVRVYDGTTAARDIAGVGPNASPNAADGIAGVVQAGLHLITVVFETASGYITSPPTTAWRQYTAPGSKKISLTNIPIGSSVGYAAGQIVKRHILVSPVIRDFNGDQENYEMYFAPGGEIANDTATSLTIDFYDSELLDSADYLLDQLTAVKAGPLAVYQGRLVVNGYTNKTSIALVSPRGEPESFNESEDFVIVSPGYGGRLRAGAELNGVYYFFKEFATFATRDNNGPASTWDMSIVDGARGTHYYGIGTFQGVPFITNNGFFVASDDALWHFDGSYRQELSYVIEDKWIQKRCIGVVAVNPDHKLVYVTISSTVEYHHLWVCDYSEGLSKESVKWCPWSQVNDPTDAYPKNYNFARTDGFTGPYFTTFREPSAIAGQDPQVFLKFQSYPSGVGYYVTNHGAVESSSSLYDHIPNTTTQTQIYSSLVITGIRFNNYGYKDNLQVVLIDFDTRYGGGVVDHRITLSFNSVINNRLGTDIKYLFLPATSDVLQSMKRYINHDFFLGSFGISTSWWILNAQQDIPGSAFKILRIRFFGHVVAEDWPGQSA